MRKSIATGTALAVVVFATVSFGLTFPKSQASAPNWTLTAPTSIEFTCGSAYSHTLDTVSQDQQGNLTGSGHYNANNAYTWDFTGSISGDSITFTILYTGLNPGYTLNATGSIANDGSISGTTEGNCTAFSMPAGSAVANGTITVTKTVVGNSNYDVSDFPLYVSTGNTSTQVSSGNATSFSPGMHYITEHQTGGFVPTFSGACTGDPNNQTLLDNFAATLVKIKSIQNTIDAAPLDSNNANWTADIYAFEAKAQSDLDGINASLDLTSGQDAACDITNTFTPYPVTVTIDKFIDGTQATASNAGSAAFPMHSCWSTTNIDSGCGNYTLSPSGFNNPNPYFATTSNMDVGADYNTYENTTTGLVGTSCDGAHPFALVGYTSGQTLWEAEQAAPSATQPDFNRLTTDEHVIVWNKHCAVGEITSPAAGQVLYSTANFTATYQDGDVPNTDDAVQWAVRQGTCAAGTGTVFGNVDGFHNTYSWDGNSFSATTDVSAWTPGLYCFVFNPTDDAGKGDVRLVRQFYVGNLTATQSPSNIDPIGTLHTITADINVPVANQNIVFEVTGVNPQAPASVPTDSSGQASFSYTGVNSGVDTITVCADIDNSTSCDPGEPTFTLTKMWLEQYVTGGGNLKTDNKSPDWTFGGNAGYMDGSATPVGQFEIVYHNKSETQACHFNVITSATITGTTIQFGASGQCNDGNSKSISVSIIDNGAGADHIDVTGDINFSGDLTGGNFTVHQD